MSQLFAGILLLAFLSVPVRSADDFTSASGSGYPSATNNYVNDFAGVLQPMDSQMLKDKLGNLEKQTGIEGVVVTIRSVSDYPTGDTSVDGFATHLFNKWGVGDKKANNGFMVLVSINDRQCRIELGEGYGQRYNDKMKEIVDQTMVPRFKAGEYGRGAYEGTLQVMERLTVKVSWFQYYKKELLIGLAILILLLAGFNCIKQGKNGWGYALFAAAGILFLILLKMIGKSKGGRSSGSFGGGSSSGGGGASGRW
jgi:uncharacterized membrane protein YgcG